MKMTISILVLWFIVCSALKCVDSDPIEGLASYVERLHFLYENGKWTCGDVKCPAEATGCSIRIKSDKNDKKVLHRSFNCIGSISAGDRIELTKEKSVIIDIKSYVGAKAAFTINYNDQDEETANGVVPENRLKELKEEFEELKRLVIEEKTGVALMTQGLYRGRNK